ncbi:MAG TPA: glycosyltransferase family 2 protein [Vicinamibacteria bacterium]|nr:glycosyltransferase family 2 protein [Vicinamibacteria bacterium]
MTPLSAVIIAQDEEENLGAAIESARFCDEVLVVDSGSRDRTCEVAAAKGARVVVNQPWPGFVQQRNFATSAARHDWILAIDADERVGLDLRREIEGLRSRGPEHTGYRIPRVAVYLGREIRATDWYPDPQLRLFDRRRGCWRGALVHESVTVDGSVGRLRGELVHRPYRDVSAHLRKIDAYTTLWARQSLEAGRRASALELVAAPAWAFLRNYLLRGGLRLGTAGFAVSGLNSYYTFVKLLKLRALEDGAP